MKNICDSESQLLVSTQFYWDSATLNCLYTAMAATLTLNQLGFFTAELGICNGLYGPHRLTYLLSGYLQKKFANPQHTKKT